MKNGKYCNGKKSLNMKPLALLLALTLLVGCAIGGTIAWLTADTGTVTNTFTVGDINITLEETGAQSNQKNYKIVPGGTDEKDPKITVTASSEKCYVYAYVKNNVSLNNAVVAIPDINTANWILVGSKTTAATAEETAIFEYLYRYKEVVDASDEAKTLPVFTEVSYEDTITKGDIATLEDTQIIIDAFAHQSANTTVDVADAAAIAAFDVTAVTTP